MRDRARAKSAESALFHIRSNLAGVLQAAQHDQERVLNRTQEACRNKLADVGEAIQRSQSRLCILKAMLPPLMPVSVAESSMMVEKTLAGNARRGAPTVVPSAANSAEDSMSAGGSTQRKQRQEIVAKQSQDEKPAWMTAKSCSPLAMAPAQVEPQDMHKAGALPKYTAEKTCLPDAAWKERLESMHHQINAETTRGLQGSTSSGAFVPTQYPRGPARESLGLLLQDSLDSDVTTVKFVTPGSPAYRAGEPLVSSAWPRLDLLQLMTRLPVCLHDLRLAD
jgi:hypothetical protein